LEEAEGKGRKIFGLLSVEMKDAGREG